MTIDQLVAMAQRIHDVEHWDLGAGSTRETRNAFWARVIGCAYHGHPSYNTAPDPQWHLKSGGGNRPQSDDVAVSMPTRAYWDCIAGVGAAGYRFVAAGHAEPLPSEQPVFPPPVPAGGGGVPAPTPTPTPTPVPPPVCQCECRYDPADLATLRAEVGAMYALVAALSDELVEQREKLDMVRAVTQDVRAALANGLAITGTVGGLRYVGTGRIDGKANG